MKNALITAACMIVILAGIKASVSLVVPFLLAIFLAILLAPPFLGMLNKGIPAVVALIAMVVALIVLATFSVTILRTSLDQFISNLPLYNANLTAQLEGVWQWIENKGVEAPRGVILENLDPKFVLNYAGRVASALSGMLGQGAIIFIIVAFMLLEASGLRQKLYSLPAVSEQGMEALEQNFKDVRRYVSMKSMMSLLTGALVTGWLWFLDIDNALFMGLLAFFLNFIPNIGSFIAAIPGVLLGFILLGPGMAAVTAVGYTVINIGVGNVLEPRFMGKGLGLSPLVIIVTLIFWGWLLGPVGMLLSIPLTMALKVTLENGKTTRHLSVLLGPSSNE